MESLEKIKQLLNEPYVIAGKNMDKVKKVEKPYNLEEDVEKFYDKGQGAAGTRVRAVMQELIKLAKDVRADVTARKKK